MVIGKKILIVEDEPIIAMEIEDRLISMGYAISGVVSSGVNAIQKTAQTSPDLVLMDIMLEGGMDGVEAAAHIRSRFDIPVIYLTAYADSNTIERVRISEPFGYLIKPFKERELHAAIEMALYKHGMEKKLRESENRYRTLAESAQDAIYILDSEGRHQYINSFGAKVIGSSPEEIIGKTMDDIFPPEISSKKNSEVKKVFKSRKPISFEINIPLSGHNTWWDTKMVPLMVQNDEVHLVMSISRDITERKLSEDRIRLQSQMIEIMAEGINLIRASDNIILYTNPEFDQMFGYKPGELVGNYVSVINAPTEKDPQEVAAEISKVLTEKGEWRGEIYNVRKDCTKFWCSVNIKAFQHPEHGTVWISVHMDINERKRAEEKILKLNRVFAVISQINQSIVRLKEKDKLLNEVCRIAVEYGKFQMAWIGMIDEKTNLVHPAAYSGVEDGYLSKIIAISVEDVPVGRGPTGTAIREGRYYVCDDIEKDPRMTPWREEALKCGYLSSIAIPIKHFGKVIGAFSLYASVPHFFDREEIDLLVEVTNDISFAIESIEMAKKNKEVEEALTTSEERFRRVFEEGPIPIALVNNSFGFLRVNSAFSAMIGYSEVELRALKFKDITHPEHIQGDLENVSRLMNGDLDVYETDKRYVAKNKEIVWAHIKVSVVHDKEGGFLYFIVIVNDITGRKKAEKALKESEDKYHSLMNQAGDAILLAEMNGNLLEVNKKAEELLGYTKEELSNMNIAQIHPKEEHERTFATFKELVQKESAFLNDGMILRKDGKIVPVDITGSAVEYAGKKVILGIFRDITERKRAEEELRLKEYQLSEAQRIAHIGSWDTDFKTGKLTWSHELYRIFGVSPDTFEVTIEAFVKCIHPDDQAAMLSWIQATFSGKKEPELDFRILLPDGAVRFIRGSGEAFFDETGNLIRAIGTAQDITERKQAELEYKTILSTALDGFYVTDSQGRILDVNDSYCSLIGYSREELLNMSIKDLDVLDSEEIIALRIKRIMETGWDRFETRHKCKDGRIVEIEASVNYNGTGGGKFFVFMRDSTERKRSEYALKESEQKHRALIEKIQDGVFIIQDGKVQFANEAFARIGGYTMEEVIRMDFQKLVAPEDLEMVANNYQQRQAGETVPREYEFRVLRKDGKMAMVIMNVGLITYQGKVASMGTVKDITERKRAEDKLLENEERYRLLVDFATFGIAIHTDHKLVYLNPAALKILGATKPEDLLGKPILEIVSPEYHDIARERIAKQETGEVAPMIDEKFVKLDGTIIDVELISIPFIYNGKQAMYGVFQDISDRKKSLEEIKKSIKEKEILLREIHHRVKNNMQIISSLLKLQADYIEDKKYLEIFKESQNRIMTMSLVHEKLYKSKDFTKINFKDYIHNLANGVFQSYSGRSNSILLILNIENLELGIDSAVPCGLIINELVTNSIKYAFPGEKKGEIKIVLSKIDANEYELKVSDNGIGIPEDIDIMKTETLGLHLVSMLAEDQLSGKINLDRSKGTEFTIRFCEEK